MGERCYWARDEDGDPILIPMCGGSAVFGPGSCTCDVPLSRIEEAERRREAAEAEVMRLREKAVRRGAHMESQVLRNRQLYQRICELEALLAPSGRLPSSSNPPPAQRAAHGGPDERKAEAADLPRVQRAGQAIRGGDDD